MTIGRKTKQAPSVETAAPTSAAAEDLQPVSLRSHAQRSLETYFKSLNGHKPSGLYALVIREVEEPLFRAVMQYTDGNQVRAAEVLGINRGTLRRKLEEYGLVQ
jgi:Fis family transcriptional regulator